MEFFFRHVSYEKLRNFPNNAVFRIKILKLMRGCISGSRFAQKIGNTEIVTVCFIFYFRYFCAFWTFWTPVYSISHPVRTQPRRIYPLKRSPPQIRKRVYNFLEKLGTIYHLRNIAISRTSHFFKQFKPHPFPER